MQLHEKVEEAKGTFLKAFEQCGNKFMAVLITPENDGKGVICSRTTFDFPKDLRFEALRELISNFIREDQDGDKPAALPFAPFVIPRDQFESLQIRTVTPGETEGEPDVICG